MWHIYLFLNWFLDFFGSIFNIVMALIFTLVGVIIGVVAVRYLLRPKNQILYLRERDGRGMELNVDQEDAISLETDTKPKLRFYKWGRAYEFRKRGRSFTRFLAKEGTGYTWRLLGFLKEKIVKAVDLISGEEDFDEANKKIDLEFPTLEEAVKFRWGDFYNTVPEQRKALLRDDKILVTVGLEEGITPKGYEPITETVVKKKAVEDMMRVLAGAFKGIVKQPITQLLITIAAGFGAGWIVHSLFM